MMWPVILCALFIGVQSISLPSYISACYRDDPQIGECLVKMTGIMKPYLKTGIKELGIPGLESIVIPLISLQPATSLFSFNASFTNAKFSGIMDYQYTKLNFDPTTLVFQGEAKFNLLTLESNLDVSGRILFVPITGRGTVFMNITNSVVTVVTNAEVVKTNGIDYIIVKNCDVQLAIGDVTAKLDDHFSGSKLLTDATLQVFHDNSKAIMKELSPALAKVAKAVYMQVMERISLVPYNELFPLKQ